MGAQHGTELVRAAQSGDPRAQDRLIALHLPLVYNIVGRAMNGHHDVDDVVQETMLRALAGLGDLRSPDSFRSWLVAITMNGVRSHWHRQQQAGLPASGLDDARELAQPGADFVELAVVRLNLSGQRRETAEATRWMEPDDRELLSLWWLECAGELSRHEVAAALGLSPQHTAVRVQRMKERLETARVVVRALSQNPPCATLRHEIDTWDGRPSALWRKRIARHARACAYCAGLWSGLVPAEGLLAGLLLVPPAALLLAGVRERAGFETVAAVSPSAVPLTGPVAGPVADPLASPDAGPLTAPSHGSAAGTGAGAGGGTGAGAGPRGGAAGRGPRSGRAARRRRRQQRGRRRAVIAAGIAVVAVTGGAFTLTTGPDEGTESRETTLAATTGTGLPAPQGSTASPAAASPSAASSPSASKTPRTTPKPSRPAPTASRTSPPPRPTRTAAPSTASAPRPTRTHTTSGSAAGSGSGSSSGSGSGSAQEQVIELVNAERAKAGCGPLTEHPLLTEAAQGHSDDMAARDFFDHTDPDGDGPGERITAAGYAWSSYGENIAKGQTTAAEVMDSWMHSPGHRANILNCGFKEIGVGLHTSGGPYWTQAFGSR
ncbi:RNA polymerase sigma factor (sigma-70 family) [Streptomyces sp. PanSC19]|uniref:sigma-70 family RNA polymerase sigma factor n=1 Tax=Streptomyces sp. PanSC19 TaxID=1520455 RepID=UPI000F47D5DE|nr:sigma-70 family RNA polymerase sigma factor [Streptomyces sp. PanSC19]ROQ35188.1 RNA polymerase sigma factor (sigma-70 family) [Streptomyces sp. PanSC19]